MLTRSRRLAAAYGRVWDAFVASSHTADGRHDNTRWREHTGPYAACIVRVNAGAIANELWPLRQALSAVPEVRLHPDGFLHVMIQELGFVTENPTAPDEITPARLEEFAIAAVEPIAATSPFSLDFGGANAFLDAVFLEVDPGETLNHLHDRLLDLAALPWSSEFSYLPHCTIAHFTGEAPTPAAVTAIAPWRGHSFGSEPITEIEIVTLDTWDPYPQLSPYAAIPLNG